MKKSLSLLLLLCLLLTIIGPAVSFAETMPAKIYFNGEILTTDVAPMNVEGRILVPVRTVFEALGAEVRWDATTMTVTGIRANMRISLQVGNKTAYRNGQPIDLDVPAKLINGRTMVPIRYVAEGLGASVSWMAATKSVMIESPMKVAMLIPGNITDGGFMEAGYNGLLKIHEELGAEIYYIDQIKPELELLTAALQELAQGSPDLIIAHGGQNSTAAANVAKEFPDIKFVVVQGGVTGDNLSSYEVLQEESAWLAGAAAGLLTESNVVGHISGIRVTPGLKGRAAFADGLKYTNPDAEYLTIFAGDQDDVELARVVAEAEIAEGADIIFTMLNAGRPGAIEAMRENDVHQIGNVVDWTEVDGEVFIASAIANVSMAGFEAAKDLSEGNWEAGIVIKIGLANPNAVRLALNADLVPDDIVLKINELAEKIEMGEIVVNIEYDGPEFELDM
jgi:basic membrane protein A